MDCRIIQKEINKIETISEAIKYLDDLMKKFQNGLSINAFWFRLTMIKRKMEELDDKNLL